MAAYGELPMTTVTRAHSGRADSEKRSRPTGSGDVHRAEHRTPLGTMLQI